MAIGQLRTVVVDCLEPEPLAEFWSALLGAQRRGRFVHESPEPFQILRDPAGNEFCLVHIPGSTRPER
jgi:hypothetical protein